MARGSCCWLVEVEDNDGTINTSVKLSPPIAEKYKRSYTSKMMNCKNMNNMVVPSRKCVGTFGFITVFSLLVTTTTSFALIRGCGAFHLIREIQPPRSTQLFSTVSKFPGIMAAEVSSTSNGFEPLTWNDEYDLNGNKRCNAVLPDDNLPPDIHTPPPMHNKRTLHYQQSLLTQDEATSLQDAAERYGKFEESNRLAGIIEDGVCIEESMGSILNPILDSKILPWAREVSSTPTLTVADALIRTYDPSQECLHLSEHYDETSYATIIIPLNDPNEYEGGLYVQSGALPNTRLHVPFTTAGDAVLHKYDVMHGVNVRRGKERCSLVIWCGENEESVKSRTVPWIIRESKSSVHSAFLYAFNHEHGLLGFDRDLEIAKQYYNWASRRGHALSEYRLWLMKEDAANNEQSLNESA